MARPDRESGRVVTSLLLGVVVVGLLGLVAYLLAEVNHRRYRLLARDGMLVVEQGRLLPWGFELFQPESKDLAAAYAPLPIPADAAPAPSEVFDDRAEIDRALFGQMAGWARARLESSRAEDFALGAMLVQRSALLPGLSEEQRLELRTLRAQLALNNGRRIMVGIEDDLRRALAEFKTARTLSTAKADEADQWILEVEARLRQLRESPGRSTPPMAEAIGPATGRSATNATPAADAVPPATPERRP